MNNMWQQFKASLARWMAGRHGLDELGMCTLFAGLLLSLAGSFSRLVLLSFPGLILYVVTLFRMFSRNRNARIRENQKYLAVTGNWNTKARQFILRQKNRKEYKYFKCPGCGQLLRLKRGCGEKDITCAKCGRQFRQKA